MELPNSMSSHSRPLTTCSVCGHTFSRMEHLYRPEKPHNPDKEVSRNPRTRQRTMKACGPCAKMRVKCEGGMPNCRRCASSDRQCWWRGSAELGNEDVMSGLGGEERAGVQWYQQHAGQIPFLQCGIAFSGRGIFDQPAPWNKDIEGQNPLANHPYHRSSGCDFVATWPPKPRRSCQSPPAASEGTGVNNSWTVEEGPGNDPNNKARVVSEEPAAARPPVNNENSDGFICPCDVCKGNGMSRFEDTMWTFLNEGVTGVGNVNVIPSQEEGDWEAVYGHRTADSVAMSPRSLSEDGCCNPKGIFVDPFNSQILRLPSSQTIPGPSNEEAHSGYLFTPRGRVPNHIKDAFKVKAEAVGPDLTPKTVTTSPSRKRKGQASPTISASDPAKSFICSAPGCNKRFGRLEHLKRHVKSLHTGEKPYVCTHPGCNSRFSRRDNLKQHLRVHSRNKGSGATMSDTEDDRINEGVNHEINLPSPVNTPHNRVGTTAPERRNRVPSSPTQP